MTITLYDALIPSFQQMLGTMSNLIDKAEAHCNEHGLEHSELVGARLCDDMLPFSYQVKSTVDHSAGAIEGVRVGVFSPQLDPPPESFVQLREKVDGGRAMLAALDPAEVNDFEGRDMRFDFRERSIPFSAENFLLSFSQPNFYFHASTAYGVLRAKGVKLGKIDFLGQLRIKA